MSMIYMNEQERLHVMDPMAAHYASQAAAFAARNPGNSEAQRTAQYWANVANHQRLMAGHLQAQIPQPVAQPSAVSYAFSSSFPQAPPPTPPTMAYGNMTQQTQMPQRVKLKQ